MIELRDGFKLPGMKILQFAFTGPDNPFLPHHYVKNCVVYTGTHDNDTVDGWYQTAPKKEKAFCRKYLNSRARHLAWDMIRAVWSSVANIAVTPMQDLLELGNEARMNFPGRESGNWHWRMRDDALSDQLRDRLLEFNTLYDRKLSR